MSYSANSRAPKPDSSNAPHEPAGPIASDSLAAESINSSGGFAENPSAATMGVRGGQSTLTTTDTSGASVLHPAPSGSAREKEDILGAGPDERGPSGLRLDAAGKPTFDGVHNSDGYYGGVADKGAPLSQGSAGAGDSDFGASTIASRDTADSNIRSGAGVNSSSTSSSSTSTSGPAAGMGARPHVAQAPGYTSTVTGAAMPPGAFKPKGSNLEDADQTDSMPKTKTFLGDVGGVHDPARLAEREFNSRNAEAVNEVSSAGVEGGRQRQKGVAGDGSAVGSEGGQYGVLGSERA